MAMWFFSVSNQLLTWAAAADLSSTEEDDDALEPKEASEAQSCDDQFFLNVKIC